MPNLTIIIISLIKLKRSRVKLLVQTIGIIFFLIVSYGFNKTFINNQKHGSNAVQSIYSELYKIPVFKKIPQNKITIEKLGGWSNFTYLINLSKNKKFVLRVPRKGPVRLKTLLKIDTYNEYVNANKAYQIGIGARAEFFDKSNGIFLFKYIENKKTLEETDIKDIKILKEVVLLLKKLHFSKIKFNNDINMLFATEQLTEFFNKHYQDNMPKDLNVLMTRLKNVKWVFHQIIFVRFCPAAVQYILIVS